jgi:hypothetical protein
MVRRLNLKPIIRVESGLFVGYPEDQQYVLGRTDIGIAPAVRKIVQLCGEDRLGQLAERTSA